MNEISRAMLKQLSEDAGHFDGAYNVRENGCCVARKSSEHIAIRTKEGEPGLEIHVLPGTDHETVYIPACVTHGGIDDLVYNDFFITANTFVTIVAGCGVHTESGEPTRHSGIHRFFIKPGAHVTYIEKHIGIGAGRGLRCIDPVTEIALAENAVLEMDSVQIGGVDRTLRKTKATLAAGAKLRIRERILTDTEQTAETDFIVELNGAGSSADIVSRSVARDHSRQSYTSSIIGNAPCSGHSECDAIIDGEASVDAAPKLCANHPDAALIHEAAIGKIAGEQILKLRTLGLTEEEAEARIIQGFLS
jgi:hypothetical protein